MKSKIHKMRFTWFLLGTAFLFGSLANCVRTRLNSESKPTSKSFVFELSCDKEAQDPITTSKVNQFAYSYSYNIAYNCSLDKEYKKIDNPMPPVNLVWTVDVSESMNPTIAAIKDSLDTMATVISEHNWSIKFAGIGFVDAFFQAKISDFVDALASKAFIDNNWHANGGGSEAEGGQEAILQALTMLRDQTAKNPESVSYLVYASDAMMHVAAQGDSTDYSIDDLVQQVNAKGAKDINFWFSIPDDPADQPAKGGYAGPKAQMRDFVQKTGVKAIELPYPIQKDAVISQFYQVFRTTTTDLQLSCFATNASLSTDPKETGVQSSSTKDIALSTKKGDLIEFATSSDVSVSHYNLSVSRCCKIREQDPNCIFVQTKVFPIEFPSTDLP